MGDHAKEETKEAPTPVPEEKKKNTTFSAVSKTKGRVGKTEEYADDRELYIPRISKEERTIYWQQLVQNKAVHLPPSDFHCWMNQHSETQKLLSSYHPRLIRMVFFITSAKWDFMYIYGLMIWCLLVGAVVDGFVPASLGFTFQSPITLLPIVVALLSQIIPSLGTLLLVHRCNDLFKLLSQTYFTQWSFASVLLAQYIEFFYYGGQNKLDAAGNVWGMKDNVGIFAILRVVVFGCKYIPPQIHPEFELKAIPDSNIQDEGASLEESKDQSGNEGDENEDANDSDEEDDDNDKDDTTVDKSKSTTKSTAKLVPAANINAGGTATVTVAAGISSPTATLPTMKNNVGFVEPKEEEDMKAKQSSRKGNDSDESEDDGEEIGYIAQLLKEERKRQASIRKSERMQREKLERECTRWEEWHCVVCGKENRRPAINPVRFSINFVTKGVYYKRHFANLKQSGTKPTCTHCYTPSNYKPPLSTAHLFKHYAKVHQAFENYPKRPLIHPGLKKDKYGEMLNKYSIFFFGINEDKHSKIVYNDWRLPKLLALQFPQVPRYPKPPEEYYEVGEFVECKYQKVDWSRCVIRNVHSNHSYDIKFNTGDEIRFVYEQHLRCPPEKRPYAYRVELGMVVMYILFPVFLLGAIAASPALLFLLPLFVAIPLIALRTRAAYHHYTLAKNAGICVAMRLWLFFTFSLWMMVFTGLLGLGANYSGAITCLIIGMVASLPILYSMRPTWAIFGAGMMGLVSVGLIMISLFLANSIAYISIGMSCLFLGLCVLHHVRSSMAGLWDVQMKIRALNPEPLPDLEVPSIITDLEMGRKEDEAVEEDDDEDDG